MRRLVLIAALSGLVLSVTTGIRPAAADDGGWPSGIDFGTPAFLGANASPAPVGLEGLRSPAKAAMVVIKFDPDDLGVGQSNRKIVFDAIGCGTAPYQEWTCTQAQGAMWHVNMWREGNGLVQAYVGQSTFDQAGGGATVSRQFEAGEDGVLVAAAGGPNTNFACGRSSVWLNGTGAAAASRVDNNHDMDWWFNGNAVFGRNGPGHQVSPPGPENLGYVPGQLRVYGWDVNPGITCEDLGGFVDQFAPAAPDTFPPRLACGRTMRDLGGGQWVADVEAFVRNPSQDPNVTDVEGEWTPRWPDGGVFPGRTASIPLPAGATTNSSLYATYTMYREVASTAAFPVGGGTWQENYLDPSDVNGGILPGWTYVISEVAKGLGLGSGMHPSATGSGYLRYEDAGGVGVQVTGGGDFPTVTKLRASCTVRISPVTIKEDGGTTNVVVINMPPHPGEDGDGDGQGDNDQDPPGNSCTSDDTGLWGVITDVVSGVKCLADLLGAVIGAIADAVVGLLDGLKDLFIPNDFAFLDGIQADLEGKFPLSVVSDVVSIGEGLDDRVRSGVDGSPCSTIDPNLDGAISQYAEGLDAYRFTLPSPEGECGEDEQTRRAADLVGWRSPIRALLGVAIWGAFAVRVLTSFGPGRSGLEPEPEALAE